MLILWQLRVGFISHSFVKCLDWLSRLQMLHFIKWGNVCPGHVNRMLLLFSKSHWDCFQRMLMSCCYVVLLYCVVSLTCWRVVVNYISYCNIIIFKAGKLKPPFKASFKTTPTKTFEEERSPSNFELWTPVKIAQGSHNWTSFTLNSHLRWTLYSCHVIRI